MSGWGRAVWEVGFGVVMMLVAFNIRDVAWRIHGYMASYIGVSAIFTPTVVRATGAVLGMSCIATGTVRLVGVFSG